MSSPALMVLYSNDAVEVRYVDQSCLQVAPCGSTFVHHQSPKEVIHPAHGMCVELIVMALVHPSACLLVFQMFFSWMWKFALLSGIVL
jgi:hypothetical protein